MKTVNWIMEMADRDNDPMDGLISNLGKKRTIKQKKLSVLDNYYSPAQWLLNAIGKYDISNQYEFPNAIHAEYFAILALAIIDGVCTEIKYPITKPSESELEEELYNLKSFSHLAFNSMEAISFANLLSSKKLDELINKQHRKKISSAAIKGHEKRRKIKIKFIEFYKNGIFKNKITSAKEFVETLSEDERNEFIDTNIENTLLKALREHKKGQFKI